MVDRLAETGPSFRKRGDLGGFFETVPAETVQQYFLVRKGWEVEERERFGAGAERGAEMHGCVDDPGAVEGEGDGTW